MTKRPLNSDTNTGYGRTHVVNDWGFDKVIGVSGTSPVTLPEWLCFDVCE